MDWGLVGLGVGVAVLVWLVLLSSASAKVSTGIFVLPPHVNLQSQPLLTETELFLYNLMRMAVQDQYLVFTQVPLWSVVRVETEGPARSEVLQRIALKRLDFVLVHSGSRSEERRVENVGRS